MTIAEIISALMKYSDDDYLIFAKTIYGITVEGDKIYLDFVDGNTENVYINEKGERLI